MNSHKWSQFYKIFKPVIQPTAAILLSLMVGAIAIIATGNNPLKVYGIMIHGAFGSEYYLLTTLNRAIPIIITGLGAAICWASNYMGIGGEGQMILGGFITAITALNCPGPVWIRVTAAVLAGLSVAGLYSWISAWLLDKFNMSLAISTLMFNYAAAYIALHFTQNVFLDKSGDKKLVQTAMLPENMRLPRIIPDQKLHWGFAVAVLVTIAVWFLMNRTSFGYESRMSGFNIHFCDYGGIQSKKIMYGMLTLSGVICGLAGVLEVFGTNYRYIHNTYVSASFAWIGLNAALISNYDPIGVFFTSIILAGISTGGAAIARSTTIPVEISSIIQGCITLFISAHILNQIHIKHKVTASGNTPESQKSIPAEGESKL